MSYSSEVLLSHLFCWKFNLLRLEIFKYIFEIESFKQSEKKTMSQQLLFNPWNYSSTSEAFREVYGLSSLPCELEHCKLVDNRTSEMRQVWEYIQNDQELLDSFIALHDQPYFNEQNKCPNLDFFTDQLKR